MMILGRPGAHANAIIPRSEPGLLDEDISYDGLLYPIMTALTGLDNDGEPEPHWPSEDHMTGDISLAMQQFYQATRNDTWLKTEAFPLLDGIARFWASKAVRNSDGSYSIPQTGSPDEYHNNITDGVFPNSIAKVSLLGAYDLAAAAGRQPNATYKTIGDGLRILYDKDRDFHPAYITGATGELYNSTCGAPEPLACINTPSGGLIKQADVVLIYYPVAINGTRYNVSIPSSTQKNDLDIYSRLTDIDGPAMTWMIHSIAYGDIGEDDKAAAFLRKSYQGLVRSPFFIWVSPQVIPTTTWLQGMSPQIAYDAARGFQPVWGSSKLCKCSRDVRHEHCRGLRWRALAVGRGLPRAAPATAASELHQASPAAGVLPRSSGQYRGNQHVLECRVR